MISMMPGMFNPEDQQQPQQPQPQPPPPPKPPAEFSLADDQWLTRLMQAGSAAMKKVYSGILTPQQGDQLLAQIEQQKAPLQQRKQQAAEQKKQQMVKDGMEQAAVAAAVQNENLTMRTKALPQQTAYIPNPQTGEIKAFVMDAKGNPVEVKWDGAGVAPSPPFGGMKNHLAQAWRGEADYSRFPPPTREEQLRDPLIHGIAANEATAAEPQEQPLPYERGWADSSRGQRVPPEAELPMPPMQSGWSQSQNLAPSATPEVPGAAPRPAGAPIPIEEFAAAKMGGQQPQQPGQPTILNAQGENITGQTEPSRGQRDAFGRPIGGGGTGELAQFFKIADQSLPPLMPGAPVWAQQERMQRVGDLASKMLHFQQQQRLLADQKKFSDEEHQRNEASKIKLMELQQKAEREQATEAAKTTIDTYQKKRDIDLENKQTVGRIPQDKAIAVYNDTLDSLQKRAADWSKDPLTQGTPLPEELTPEGMRKAAMQRVKDLDELIGTFQGGTAGVATGVGNTADAMKRFQSVLANAAAGSPGGQPATPHEDTRRVAKEAVSAFNATDWTSRFVTGGDPYLAGKIADIANKASSEGRGLTPAERDQYEVWHQKIKDPGLKERLSLVGKPAAKPAVSRETTEAKPKTAPPDPEAMAQVKQLVDFLGKQATRAHSEGVTTRWTVQPKIEQMMRLLDQHGPAALRMKEYRDLADQTRDYLRQGGTQRLVW